MKLTPPTKTPKKYTLKKVLVVNKFKNNLEEKNSKYIFQNKWKKPECRKLYVRIDHGLKARSIKDSDNSNQ